MVMIGANGNRPAYGIKHYNADTEKDREAIITVNLTPGSTVFVIENSKQYMLNSARKWVLITPFGSSSNGGYDGGDIDTSKPNNPDNTDPTPDSGAGSGSGDNLYDGGDLDA